MPPPDDAEEMGQEHSCTNDGVGDLPLAVAWMIALFTHPNNLWLYAVAWADNITCPRKPRNESSTSSKGTLCS